MSRPRLLPWMVAAASLACGEAKNASYQGAPLITLQGDLLGLDEASASGPIRMAVLWYSVQDPFSSTNPPAIVPADVQYQGSFPLAYTFSLYEPPPAAALTSFHQAGQTVQVATGIIAAYRDDNGNGTLDIIPTNQAPVDTVLGVSMPANGDPYSDQSYTLTYFDQAVGSTEALTGGTPGFHLRRAGVELDPSTRVPLNLSGSPDLNLFVCAQLYSVPQVTPQPGSACAVQPSPALLQVVGVGGIPQTFFSVTNGTLPVTNAEVQVDGRSLTWDSSLQIFTASGLLPGSHAFVASAPGLGTARGSFQVMTSPTVIAPNAGATLPSDLALHVSWKQMIGVSGYHVYVDDTGQTPSYDEYTTNHFLQTPPLDIKASGSVSVVAYAPSSIQDLVDSVANVETLTQIFTSSATRVTVEGRMASPWSPDETRVLQVRGRITP
jgi:hypothetical protein